MAKLGILFDIEKLGSGAYGFRAYQTLLNIVERSLLFGCTLSDGDVGDFYCIAIESFEVSRLHQIKSAVFRSNAHGLAPRQQRFIESRNVEQQPLVIAGFVDTRGNLQRCETWYVQQAWNAKKDNAQHAAPDLATTLSGTSAAPAERSKHPSEHSPGEIFGKQYLILDVRRGGMGLVYIVEDLERLKEGIILRIAFKTFQAKYLWDNNAIRRFEREALNWVQLGKHTNVVHALLVQQIEAKPYIWLEFVDGMSLAEHLAARRPDVKEAIDIALQFCSGMRYAKEQHGLIHRDVKPGNIMISGDGVVKITDFGLSKIQAEFAETESRRAGVPMDPDQMQTISNVYATGAGVCVGTPAYIAPEAILHPQSVDTRADIYSFGIVLYEMLTGGRPFHGPRILEQQVRASHARPSILNRDIPEALDQIVDCCLAKDPNRRFQSFAVLQKALLELSDNPTESIPVAKSPIGEKEKLLLQGFSFMELGKYQEAIRSFEEVLRRNDRDEEAHNNIGVCLGNLGRFEEALPYLEKAVAIRSEYPEAWGNLGAVYYKLNRYEDGLRACHRAILLKPDWAEAHSNKGVNLLGLGQFDEAMSCFQSAAQADPKYWKAYAQAGEAYARRREPRQALELLTRALAIAPREVYLLVITTACLVDLGRIAEAKQFLAKALEIDPNHPDALQLQKLIQR